MRLVRSAAGLALGLAVAYAVNVTAGPAYEQSKHGDPVNGVLRLPEEGRGSCSQCHDEHASLAGALTGGPFDRTLFTVDDETLCYECHSAAGANRVYPGNVAWADSTHSTSPEAYWRGPVPPARPSGDAGQCVNCHDPHGADDALGVIPSMLRLREEALCAGCHDGVAAKDVKTQIAKTWRHPFERTRRHSSAEATSPAHEQYDDSGLEPRRHVECDDCHNAHVASSDVLAPVAPEATARLKGVSRISVVNGLAGSRPTYQWKAADDLVDPLEYEVCFKCHSSWVQLPAGKPDLALVTNPDNPSYHPIQGRGRNANIDAAAFEPGWAWDSLVFCADCHGSDDPLVRGPHGSANRFILRRPSPVTSSPQPMTPTSLCFSCHLYDVYGDAAAKPGTQRASRFNRPKEQGHAYHVGAQAIPCYACHATHGSTTLPALIVTGRTPGIASYSQDAGGGTCSPSCHVTRSYSVNYAR